jgi:tRNA A-37 threonylcarbamoyl transferase component Bud32
MTADNRLPLAPCDGSALDAGDPLLTTLLADQRSRWLRGERRPAEDYLAQQPELMRHAEVALDVIVHEILLRVEQGEAPDLGEYQNRFPHLAEQLRIQFEVEQYLHASASSESVGSQNETTTGPYISVAPSVSGAPAIPGFEILEELGRGGMGVVYKARQIRLNRIVALKMILSGSQAGAEEHMRFLVEAEVIASIHHPGIVGVHEFGTQDGAPWFALEYCPGGTLAVKLNGTPLPPTEAAEVVEKIARAVQAVHDRGVVHRDLKPANILLVSGGVVSVRQLNANTPRDLETICLKSLEKDPQKRYPSAAALADDVRRFLNHEPIRARPASVWERLAKWARRERAKAALVAVSLLTFLIVIGGVIAGLSVSARFYREELRTARAHDDARRSCMQCLVTAQEYVDTARYVEAEKELEFAVKLLDGQAGLDAEDLRSEIRRRRAFVTQKLNELAKRGRCEE